MTRRKTNEELVALAVEASRNAVAPHSNFHVGAALEAANGTIYTGCNVESDSYGLTICAERVAVTAAVTAGQRNFRAIALVTAHPTAPCGACRQVLAEFCGDDFPIYLASADDLGKINEFTLGELLPEAFRFQVPPH